MVFGLAACSDDRAIPPPTTVRPSSPITVGIDLTTATCVDRYAEGADVDELLHMADEVGCLNELGFRVFDGFLSGDCPDGRELYWNNHGWGYAGGTWHRGPRADGHSLPPDEDFLPCAGDDARLSPS